MLTIMPDSDPSMTGDSSGQPYEPRHLPVPISQPSEVHSQGWFGRAVRALFGWKSGSIRSDLQDVLESATPGESGFLPQESRMLSNILSMRERRVDDVMIPRADIVAVQQDIPLGELMRTFERAGHSRLVAYNDTLDDPVGMVHIRDLIGFMTTRAAVDAEKNAKRKKPLPANLDLKSINLAMPLSAANFIREILFVPPSMRVIDLLAKMQATRIHLSLVVDEYGGTDGIVSIEDIVEEIVGEIGDEHDDDESPGIVRQQDDTYIADARAKIGDVVSVIGSEFDIGDAADEVDTLAGYLVTRAGRLPVRGELIPGPGLFEMEVLDADPRRIKSVRIYKLKDRHDRPREPRRRETETGHVLPISQVEDIASGKDSGRSSDLPESSTPRRP